MAPERRGEQQDREGPHRGLLGFLVMVSLAEGEAHGYEVMRRIERVTGGYWRPGPGSLYPVIDSLEKEGFIECAVKEVKGKARRVCKLTDDGWSMLLDLLEKKIEAYLSILDHSLNALKEAARILGSERVYQTYRVYVGLLEEICDKHGRKRTRGDGM